MLFSNRKWKNTIALSLAGFILILIFEIIPGYTEYSNSLFTSTAGSKYNDIVSNRISYNKLIKENYLLSKQLRYESGSAGPKINLSYVIMILDSISHSCGSNITLIRPFEFENKKAVSSRNIEVIQNSKYLPLYNFFQMLSNTSINMKVKEINIRVNEDLSDSLTCNTVLEVYSGL